jgi:hypothetical protein
MLVGNFQYLLLVKISNEEFDFSVHQAEYLSYSKKTLRLSSFRFQVDISACTHITDVIPNPCHLIQRRSECDISEFIQFLCCWSTIILISDSTA